MKKIKNEFISNDIEINNILNNYKTNEKIYKKVFNTLNILGTFENNIEVNIYDIKKDEKEEYIKLWCNDINDNIFIFYVTSNNKNDLNKIYKLNNKEEIIYDLTLSKKFELSKENIDFIRTGSIYNFKFGRLITDEKTFYSIFLGNNIGYQIIIDYDNDNATLSEDIINCLNKFDKIPSLLDFTKIFEKLINNNNIKLNNINLSVYKEFKRIGSLESKNKKSKVLRKINKD